MHSIGFHTICFYQFSLSADSWNWSNRWINYTIYLSLWRTVNNFQVVLDLCCVMSYFPLISAPCLDFSSLLKSRFFPHENTSDSDKAQLCTMSDRILLMLSRVHEEILCYLATETENKLSGFSGPCNASSKVICLLFFCSNAGNSL